MAGVETILEKLRTSLGRRGAEGVRGLGRHFKIIDRDNSHTLDAEEFSNCCRINKLGLTKQEEGQLFVAFDKDMSGTVDYEEVSAPA
jgi:Ca2+-binding EF-hand superfamily protein